ncbi:MAG: mevalonate kinase [Nannocystaceae bacterium]
MIAALHPCAEAYGKVIVLGEHSVVYGKPAVAAGLPNGLVLRARPLPDSAEPCRLRIPAWGLDLSVADVDHPVATAAATVLDHCRGPRTGWAIDGETCLPARAGLGSSATLTVALARLVLGPEAEVAAIEAASLAGERVFHGEPSGLDSAIAARGGVLRFVRGEPVRPIAVRAPIPLVILPSGVARSTAVEVAKVRARKERLPTLLEPILGALAAAAEAGIAAIESNDLGQLGEIMNVSHELVSALGVGHPALDRLVARALEGGALGAKLTGAGGGGCVVALRGPDDALVSALAAEGTPAIPVEIHG